MQTTIITEPEPEQDSTVTSQTSHYGNVYDAAPVMPQEQPAPHAVAPPALSNGTTTLAPEETCESADGGLLNEPDHSDVQTPVSDARSFAVNSCCLSVSVCPYSKKKNRLIHVIKIFKYAGRQSVCIHGKFTQSYSVLCFGRLRSTSQ